MKTLLVGAITASLLAAVVVYTASALQTPNYEASVEMWVNFQKLDDLPLREPGGVLGVRDLTELMASSIDTSPNAREAIRRLGLEMSPTALLADLTVEPVEGTNLVRLTYEGTDPEQTARIASTLAEVASAQPVKVSPRGGGSKLTVALYEKATVPDSPASPKPLRNGLIAFVAGLMLCTGLTLALPGVGTRVAGALGKRPSHKGVGQAGMLLRRHSTPSIVERVKEKKLLLALGRRGKLTAAEAAQETSLSVEEARRMLLDA